MKIAIASDLHLDAWNSKAVGLIADLFRNHSGAEVLVLAGDIAEGRNYKDFDDFWFLINSEYDRIYIVPGNHEYYRSSWNTDLIRKALRPYKKIKILDNRSELFGGVRFVGSTMWTDIKNSDPSIILRSMYVMNDYRVIIDDSGKPIRPADTIGAFYRNAAYLKRSIKTAVKNSEPLVVITHHAPSEQSIDPLYSADDIKYNYFSPVLENDILQPPDGTLWIHGHTHEPADYKMGEVRVVSNPGGYPGQIWNTQEMNYSVTVLEVPSMTEKKKKNEQDKEARKNVLLNEVMHDNLTGKEYPDKSVVDKKEENETDE